MAVCCHSGFSDWGRKFEVNAYVYYLKNIHFCKYINIFRFCETSEKYREVVVVVVVVISPSATSFNVSSWCSLTRVK